MVPYDPLNSYQVNSDTSRFCGLGMLLESKEKIFLADEDQRPSDILDLEPILEN